MHPLLLIFSLILSTSLHAATGGGLTPDNTAGTAVTLQDQTRIIAGGTAQGGNLLHSFREFNVETGQTADFRAAADTQNIVSRVTGPNDSWVDGQIRSTTSDANLYLVNPNGIVMGENASLDVNGAFHATTADYVTLADGQRIYADADQGVTLTVAAPEAFGFLDASVGKIQISGSQLRVAEGQAISLVGGEIDITSSPKSDAKLEAAGGRIDLVGVASAGKVKLTSNDITNTTATKANISLTDSTVTADNHTDSKTVGTIQLQGADITVNNSRLQADNNSSVSAAGHSVELDATQDIRFTGSQITAIVNSSGKGGDVTLTAAGQVSFAGANEAGQPSGIAVLTKSTEDDAGTGGNVSIQAQDIQFAEGADISATTFGPGQGGTVSLDAENQIAFQGAVITVDTLGTGANAGDAGDLTLQTRGDIRFTDVAQLSARTLSAGKGGDVTLTAAGQVSFAGENDDSASGIYVRTESTEDDAGAGGSVSIQAQDIEFAEGAEISAITFG
ncbi:MAG: filamentous hemagglutinin N-terminal domain-containing protein, partial [Pseudomonadota bacterium]